MSYGTYVNSCRVVSDDMGDAVPLWRNESCKCVFFKIIWQEVQKENDYRDPPQAAIFLYFKRTGKNTGKYWKKKHCCWKLLTVWEGGCLQSDSMWFVTWRKWNIETKYQGYWTGYWVGGRVFCRQRACDLSPERKQISKISVILNWLLGGREGFRSFW